MNKVVHFEIPAKKMDRAMDFYKKVFDWKFNKEMDDYMMAITTKTDDKGMNTEVGAINGAVTQADDHNQSTVLVVEVDDVDKYLEEVQKAGGAVVTPKYKMGEYGYYAKVIDTEENVIGLWQPINK